MNRKSETFLDSKKVQKDGTFFLMICTNNSLLNLIILFTYIFSFPLACSSISFAYFFRHSALQNYTLSTTKLINQISVFYSHLSRCENQYFNNFDEPDAI